MDGSKDPEVAMPRPNRTRFAVAAVPFILVLTNCPHPEQPPEVDCYGVPDDSPFCFTLHSFPEIASPGQAVGGRIGASPRESIVFYTIEPIELKSLSWEDGEFNVSPPAPFDAQQTQLLRLVDLSGDSLPDLFVSRHSHGTFVMVNTGETFAPPQWIEIDVDDGRRIPVDVDANGLYELLVGDLEEASLWRQENSVWIPQGSKFAVPSCYTLHDGVVADFNDDGYDDVAFIGSPAPSREGIDCLDPPGKRGVKVLLSNPNTHLLEEGAWVPIEMASRQLVSGDFDGDGPVDLAVSDDAVVVVQGLGNGQFGTPQVVFEGYSKIVSGDFDGDGVDELAVTRLPDGPGKGELWLVDDVLAGASATRIGTRDAYVEAQADLNNDGIDDLALETFDTTPPSLEVLLSAR